MDHQEVPAAVLEEIRNVEGRAREAGDRIRQARDLMEECAEAYEQLDQRMRNEPWYTEGLAEESERLRQLVAALESVIQILEARGW